MAKLKRLSHRDKVTLEKNFPIYTKIKYTEMFESLFKKFHSEKKLDFALKYIDYQPFKNALKNHDYEFFNQLVEALPQERYKKLMLMYDKCELIELFFLSLDNDSAIDSGSRESILKVWNNITSLMPEEAKEIAKAYPESKLKEITLNENNHEFTFELSRNDAIYENMLGKRMKTDDPSIEPGLKKQITEKASYNSKSIGGAEKSRSLKVNDDKENVKGLNHENISNNNIFEDNMLQPGIEYSSSNNSAPEDVSFSGDLIEYS